MKKVDAVLLDVVSGEAKKSERLRKNFNFHSIYDDPINRMLNAFEPETYVQPHKHEDPDKVEVFVLLRGKALVVEFDNTGKITDYVLLSRDNSLAVEIPERVWHTIISLEQDTVLYEIKQGPYVQAADKNFALWAPKEGDADCMLYNQNILKKLGF